MEFHDQTFLIADLAMKTPLDIIRMSGIPFSMSLFQMKITFELHVSLLQANIVMRNLVNWS